MKEIIIIHPRTGQRVGFTNEDTLRDYLLDIFPSKDRRAFQLQASLRVSTLGQIPELLDRFKIDYEFIT